MTERYSQVAGRIRDGLGELALIVQRIHEAWGRAVRSGDDFYLDSVALNLHGFYSGLEQLFKLIAAIIDSSVPQGANWHKLLLDQMAAEIALIRPAAISEKT